MYEVRGVIFGTWLRRIEDQAAEGKWFAIACMDTWVRAERVRLSRHAALAKVIGYMLRRWPIFELVH